MKNLDFLVIGAQKAGTTSLFEYVRHHPGLHLPSEKEVSYFNLESRVARGWEWYLDWVFADAPRDRPWGTFSTFYMDAAVGREDTVPRRIREAAPDVKLIAIVRDPVERAISHHRMSVMKRLEGRSFEQAIDELLEDGALTEARLGPTEANSYITRGEYGRAIGNFLEVFPREQVLVIFAEDLDRDPAAVLREIFSFVGVDAEFVPPNVGERYRRAGEQRRIASLCTGGASGWRPARPCGEHGSACPRAYGVRSTGACASSATESSSGTRASAARPQRPKSTPPSSHASRTTFAPTWTGCGS